MVSLFTEQAAKSPEHFAELTSTKEGKATIKNIAQDLQGKSARIQHYLYKILPAFPVAARNDVRAWLEYKWQAKGDAAGEDGFVERVERSLDKWMKIGVRPLAEKQQIQALKTEIARKKQAQKELWPNHDYIRDAGNNPCTKRVNEFLAYLKYMQDQARNRDVVKVERAAVKGVNENDMADFLFALDPETLNLNAKQKAHVKAIKNTPNDQQQEEMMLDILLYEDWPDKEKKWEAQYTPLERALISARDQCYDGLLALDIRSLPAIQQGWVADILALKEKGIQWWKLQDEITELEQKIQDLVDQRTPLEILRNNFQRAFQTAYKVNEGPMLWFRRDVLNAEGHPMRAEMLQTLYAFTPDINAMLKWRGGDFVGLDRFISRIDESQKVRNKAAECEKALQAALRELSTNALQQEIEIFKTKCNNRIQDYVDQVSELAESNADLKHALNQFQQDQNIIDFYNACRRNELEDIADSLQNIYVIFPTKMIELCQKALKEKLEEVKEDF